MRIYLVRTEKGRWTFAAESPLPTASDVEAGSGLWIWLARISREVRASLDHRAGPVGRILRRILARLQAHISPEETMLKQMRKETAVDVIYSETLKEDVVRRRFLRFLRRRVRSHTRWLVINFLLLPLTGVMMILPGPNVFFGWNAFRVISHHLARQGGLRVLRGEVSLSFIPASEGESNVRSPTAEPVSTVV